MAAADTIPLKIYIQQKVGKGEKLFASGDLEVLGAGDTDKALPLPWSIGDHWTAIVEVPADKEIKFRLFKLTADKTIEWEAETSRSIKTVQYYGINTNCKWGETSGMDFESYRLTVPLKITTQLKVNKGEKIYAWNAKTLPDMPAWTTETAINIQWYPGDWWTTTILIPVGEEINFRLYKMASDGSITWEGDKNRSVMATLHDNGLTATCEFGKPEETAMESHKLTTVERATIAAGKFVYANAPKLVDHLDEVHKKATADTTSLIGSLTDKIKSLGGKKDAAPDPAS